MPSSAVLASKLAPPRILHAVERPRVVEALRDGMNQPLTWLVARPGAGKSVALAQLASTTRSVVWVRLDEGDVDVAAFFRALVASVRKTWPRRKLQLPPLRPGHLVSIESYAARFAESAFGRCRIPPVVVLDDYHRLGDAADVDRAVIALASSFTGRVLVASRTPPPPSFARVRVAGDLQLLEGELLDFTPAETLALCEARGLATAQPAEVLEATDGWATAVALMAAHGTAPAATSRLVFDYFAFEVFERLDERSQEVLLATAFLPTIDTSLASRLTQHDPAPVLESLAREALFTRREQSTGCFRHHDLFRDFLQARLRADSPEKERSIIRETANALATVDPAAAGALLIRVSAWDRLAMLVLSTAVPLAETGRLHTLSSWVLALPADVVASQPWLSYWLGVACLATRPTEARVALQRAFRAFAAASDPIGYAMAFSSLITAITSERNDLSALDEPVEDLFSRLERGWPPLDPFIEANLASGVAIALSFREPDHPRLPHWQDRAQELVAYLPAPELRALALGRVSLSAIWSGDFVRAAATLDPLTSLAENDRESPFLPGAMYSALIYLALYTAPRDCRRWRDRGLASAAATGSVLWSDSLRQHDCAALLSLGRLDEAEAELERLGGSAHATNLIERGYHAELRAWLALARGQYRSAIRFAEQGYQYGVAYGARLPCWSTQYATALAHLGLGQTEQAEALLDGLDQEATSMRFFPCMVAFARARMARLAGDERAALSHLTRALDLCAELGCLNFFYWCNADMASLLLLAMRHGIQPELVREMVHQHQVRIAPPPELAFVWPQEVEVEALGPLRVRLEGAEPVTLTGMRAALLSELVAARDGLPQQTLCDLLWPNADGDNAVRSLHTTLHRLRQLLGKESVVHDGSRVRLDPQRCRVDAWVLQDVAGRAIAPELRDALRHRVRGEALENVRLSWATRAWTQQVDEAVRALQQERVPRSRIAESPGGAHPGPSAGEGAL